MHKKELKKKPETHINKDFPGCPVLKTSPFNAGSMLQSLVGELRSHRPHASWPKKKKKRKKQYCNKFNKDFKNGLHFKKSLKNTD